MLENEVIGRDIQATANAIPFPGAPIQVCLLYTSVNSPDLPLLLLDNSNMISVLNEGEFRCHNLTFEEARAILETLDVDSILRCFSNKDLENVIFDYLGVDVYKRQRLSIRQRSARSPPR